MPTCKPDTEIKCKTPESRMTRHAVGAISARAPTASPLRIEDTAESGTVFVIDCAIEARSRAILEGEVSLQELRGCAMT